METNRKTTRAAWIHGLYAVTPDEADTARLLALSGAILRGGACALQYRNKTATRELALEQAQALRALAREFNVPFAVNDSIELALACDADAIHVGESDTAVAELRASVGQRLRIGASCYGSIERAAAVVAAGADYIAFGGFYPSRVKKYPVTTPLSMLADARALGVPVVAIGGITAQNAQPLIDAGADAVAVISGVFAAPDPEAAARSIVALFA
jgi:thiamine-phosphate pyrophosphorylase